MRVEVFSKIRQISLPLRCCCSVPRVLGALQVARQVEQVEELALGEVLERQAAAALRG